MDAVSVVATARFGAAVFFRVRRAAVFRRAGFVFFVRLLFVFFAFAPRAFFRMQTS